jgi:hypothetical protein
MSTTKEIFDAVINQYHKTLDERTEIDIFIEEDIYRAELFALLLAGALDAFGAIQDELYRLRMTKEFRDLYSSYELSDTIFPFDFSPQVDKYLGVGKGMDDLDRALAAAKLFKERVNEDELIGMSIYSSMRAYVWDILEETVGNILEEY